MRDLFSKLIAEESAQDLAEYGIALAVIAAAVGGIALAVKGDINTLWTNAQSAIHSAV